MGKRILKRVTVSMEAKLVRQIDEACRAMDMNRSQFLRDAAMHLIEDTKAQQALLSDAKALQVMAQAFAKPDVWGALLRSRGKDADSLKDEQAALTEFLEAAAKRAKKRERD